MDYKTQILNMVPDQVKQKLKNMVLSCDDPQQRDCNNLNALEGDLKGYDCRLCKNKGVRYVVKEGYLVAQECECMPARETLARIRKSGLESVLRTNTFERYLAKAPWQVRIKQEALRYLSDHNGRWFFIGGQAGAGKTHICTALVGQLIHKGYGAKYMLWKDESAKLKRIMHESAQYERLLQELKSVPVLYIDDFFKTSVNSEGNKTPPTQGDINLAFEILNYRYNQDRITIISSEMTIKEIIACDEAVGSRIFQKTHPYSLNLSKDKAKNQRLKQYPPQ